jgi:tetratricopeptide (TPR) repeat protein
MKYLLVLVIAITACHCGGGGGDRDDKPTTRVTEPTDVIDQELMVALLQAKNFHHKAKVYMADGNTTAAIASVREILSLRFPANAPEADDVRADARALLGKLLVGQNQLDEAMRVVDEGIAHSARQSFFVANLYTVKGEIHQARAEQLDAAGDAASKAKATDEKHAAIEAWDRSIVINKKLQDRLMEEK